MVTTEPCRSASRVWCSAARAMAGVALMACTGQVGGEMGRGAGPIGPGPMNQGMGQGRGGAPGGAGGPPLASGGAGVGPAMNTGGTADGMPSGGTGGSVVVPPPATCQAPAFAPVRIWRLTRLQYTESLKQLGVTAPGATDSFDRMAGARAYNTRADLLPAPKFLISQLYEGARSSADVIIRNARSFAPCMATASQDPACVRSFVEGLALKAFRRPLLPDETTEYMTLHAAKAKLFPPADVLRLLVRGLLMAPGFVYRTELGDPAAPGGQVKLAPYEIASAMSYSLTNAPPDNELIDMARTGRLADRVTREGQAIRLLKSPVGQAAVLGFFHEYLELDRIDEFQKNTMMYPKWNDSMGDTLIAGTQQLVRDLLWTGPGTFAALMTTQDGWVNDATSWAYGMSGVTGRNYRKVALPASQRSGLLTQPSFMAAFATDTEGELVHRGLFVLDKMLCQPPPPPPPTLNVNFPPADPNLTRRQRFERHASDPTCRPCHQQLDPAGAPFENYDATGQYVTMDTGRAIDARGALVGLPGGPIAVDNAIDLSRKLATLPEAQTCFQRQAYRYLLGRNEGAFDACALADLRAQFNASNGNVLELLSRIASNEYFVTRVK